MKIGVVQGRLSEPIDGFIQDFPEDWEREFSLLAPLGLDHIEWLVTKKSFEAGALNVDCSKYSDKITSIGCDNLTNKNICSKDFLSDQLEPICEFALRNNIYSITIPLLEDSKIDGREVEFIKNIEYYPNKYPDIKFNFELESDYEVAADLCSSNKNFFLTYDCGNITACKFNHYEYITNCYKFITTVHLKDKTIKPVSNVEPGTGHAKFNLIFKTLKDLKYKGLFTLQTNRDAVGSELKTISRHKKFFEDLYERII